jgi:hypothetical protein
VIQLSLKKTQMRVFIFIAILMSFCLSCKKEGVSAGERVEIYLLKTVKVVNGKCQIDAVGSVREDTPVVKNTDIFEYAAANYRFKLSDSSIQKINKFYDGTPFAVTVDKKIIYYGIFKPGFSSSSCDHSITMAVYFSTGEIRLNLGYPGSVPNSSIDDQRNNSLLIATLKKQGKLK